MRRIVFTAVLAFVATQASVQAAGPMAIANTNFPARINQHAELLKKYDTDGDGKLNDAERKTMMEERHAMMEKMMKAREKEFDKDGDGKLNDQERAAMMAEMQKRRPNGPNFQEMVKRFDKDGDGKLNDEERAAMMAEMQKRRPNGPQFQERVKRFDKDGDGKLNDEERKAMMEARTQADRMAHANAATAATNALPIK